MSVVPSDIVVYGSANMPETDGVTAIGGAVDFTRRAIGFGTNRNSGPLTDQRIVADAFGGLFGRFDRRHAGFSRRRHLYS